MTERFTFSTLPSGVGPRDFGTLCAGWSVERAEHLLSQVLALGPSLDTAEEFGIVTKIKAAPEQANVLFTALFAATYAIYVRVVMKVPRSVFVEFKGGISESLVTAMVRHGVAVPPETINQLRLFIMGFSIAVENDLQPASGDDDAVNVSGSEVSKLLVETLLPMYAKKERQSKKLAVAEDLALHGIFSNAPMDLMLGLKTVAGLTLAGER